MSCECHVTNLVGAEGLLHVGVLEEASDGQDVGASVHHDEEEHTRREDPGNLGVILETEGVKHKIKGVKKLRPDGGYRNECSSV